MILGYARVSTNGQNLETQCEHLKSKGCEKIYQEKRTGFDRHRPQLAKMLKEIDSNDQLIVTSLDRLARSTHDLFEITKSLEEKGAQFQSLREPWADTASSMGAFLLTVFAGLSELERNLILERTQEGRLSAQNRGVKFGRKPTLTPHQQSQVKKMLQKGESMRSIARHFNVGIATIHRIKVVTLDL